MNIFRVFLSSTFSDFQAERDILRDRVWPKLEHSCAEKGSLFQVIDLRWGISPQAATSHETLDICLEEVRRCKELSPSPKPNFIMLVGDRYGWRPPAQKIPDDDFLRITASVSPEDSNFLHLRYRKDENSVLKEWCLKPQDHQSHKSEEWILVEKRLNSILWKAAEALSLTPDKYLLSATHREILEGMLPRDQPKDNVLAIFRDLIGLPETVTEGVARRYADFLDSGARDDDSVRRLEGLREEISNALPAEQILSLKARWRDDEVQQVSHDHLDALCEAVEKFLHERMDAELTDNGETSVFDEELAIQEAFLKERRAIFLGRDRELKRILSYLESGDAGVPLIIRGPGGSGKSALMAQAAGMLGSYVYYRFIGASPRSWSVRTFLEDLITQITADKGSGIPELTEDGGIEEIAGHVYSLLKPEDSYNYFPLFIDAIDQFIDASPSDYRYLFPEHLPEGVRLVLSVIKGEKGDHLAAMYPGAEIIDLEKLSGDDCGKILEANLRGRSLTPAQRDSILVCAEDSGHPFWLSLAAPIERRLHSWDEPPRLPVDLKSLTHFVIDDIAGRHGRMLTYRSLQYIRLSRFGLSESELQGLLWNDPEVRDEFNKARNKDQPDIGSLPPVMWSRLYSELDPYLNTYWMDGQLLYRFFHRIFGEAAEDLCGTDWSTLHGRIADWFHSRPLLDGRHPNGRRLMEEAWHLVKAGRVENSRNLIMDFGYAMAKCALNRSDDWVEDFRRAAEGTVSGDFDAWSSFALSSAHILRRGNVVWPAHKILLQLASEYAIDNPVAIAAEGWLAAGSCDWKWLRKIDRDTNRNSPLLAAIDVPEEIHGVLRLRNGTILSWSYRSIIRIWEQSGVQRAEFKPRLPSGAGKPVDAGIIRGVLELDDGRMLAWFGDVSEDPDGRVWIFDPDFNCLGSLEIHAGFINGALVLHDHTLLSWSNDHTLAITDIDTGTITRRMKGHTDSVIGAFRNIDGSIVSWSTDLSIRIWKTDGSSVILSKHKDKDIKVFQLGEGRFVSWDHESDEFLIWSKEGELDLTIPFKGWAFGVLQGPGDTILGLVNKTIMQWDRSGVLVHEFKGHTGNVVGVKVLPDGSFISWEIYGTLRIWYSDVDAHPIFEDMSMMMNAFLLDDTTVLAWSLYSIRIFDIKRKPASGSAKKDKLDIYGVVVHPNGNTITWSRDGKIALWDAASTMVKLITTRHYDMRHLNVFPNGNLVSLSSSGALLFTPDGTIIQKYFISPKDYHNGIIILSDDAFLAWGPRATWLMNTMSGEIITYRGYTSPKIDSKGNILVRKWDWNEICDEPFHLLNNEFRLIQSVTNVEYDEFQDVSKQNKVYVDPLARNGYFLVDHDSGSPGGINSCSLMYKRLPESFLECCWYSNSGCRPYYLYPDGRVLVEAEGDACFLHLYNGNKKSAVIDGQG